MPFDDMFGGKKVARMLSVWDEDEMTYSSILCARSFVRFVGGRSASK